MKSQVPTPTSTKRRLRDEDEEKDLMVIMVDVDSGDEQSGVRRTGFDKSGKKAHIDSDEKDVAKGLEDRKIILGKPLSGKAF